MTMMLIPSKCVIKLGWFSKTKPLSKIIYENIAWGARINGYKENLDDLVEDSLRKAALWDEVKDELRKSGLIALPADSSKGFALPGCWL
jgi:ABC-type phosphate transport system ATPase subunit